MIKHRLARLDSRQSQIDPAMATCFTLLRKMDATKSIRIARFWVASVCFKHCCTSYDLTSRYNVPMASLTKTHSYEHVLNQKHGYVSLHVSWDVSWDLSARLVQVAFDSWLPGLNGIPALSKPRLCCVSLLGAPDAITRLDCFVGCMTDRKTCTRGNIKNWIDRR